MPLNIKRIERELKQFEESKHDNVFIKVVEKTDTHYLLNALIMCKDTDSPYFGGVFLFSITLDSTFPFKPPTVYFETQTIGRIHPNLYRSPNGKVCLSMINTFGEGWSPILSVEKILLSIEGILTANAMRNEPGQEKGNDLRFDNCARYMSLLTLKSNNTFKTEIENFYNKHKDEYQKSLDKLREETYSTFFGDTIKVTKLELPTEL